VSSKTKIILICIIVAATALRLLTILKYGAFIWDEIFSFTYSQKTWLESIKIWLWETNPPLHMAILKIWFYIFPTNEFFTRLPSLIFGVLSVCAVYKTTLKIFNNNRLAVISATVLAFSPYHIFMSATGRGYSLLILLDILSVYFFYQIFFENKSDKKSIFFLGLINLLLMFTHLTSVIIIVGQLIVLAVQKSNFKFWFKINAIPLLCFGVWSAFSLPLKINFDLFGSGWYFWLKTNLIDIINSLQPLLLGPHYKISGCLISAIFILTSGIIIYRQIHYKNTDTKFIILLTASITPIIAAGMLGLWNIKFFIIVLPWFAIIIAYLINKLIKNNLLATGIIILLVLPGWTYLYKLLPLNDWRIINNYLAENYQPAKKQVFIYNLFIDKLLIERYYQSPIPTLPYFTGTDWAADIVSKNYLRYIHPQDEINQWLNNQQLENFDEIFLEEEKCGIDLSTILPGRGWKLKKIIDAHQLDRKKLYHYVRH